MYLHIGNNKNVRSRNIIGIFDTDNATVSPITRSFLKINEKRGRVSSAVDDIPKSFVVYLDSDNKALVCFSQLSSSALGGRSES